MRQFQNIFAVVLVVFLSLLPLAIKILQEGFNLQVFSADAAQFNLVFLFACVAGIITWRDDRHLSLASIFDTAPEKLKRLVGQIRNVPVVAILTALFFTAFSQSFTAFLPTDKIWGIPILLFFIILPIMYFSMLVMIIMKKEYPISSVIGLVVGFLISTGPLSGILYYAFNLDNISLPFLYKITELWMALAQHAFPFFIILFICFAVLGVPLFIVISAIAYIAFSQAGYVEVISLEVYNILTDKSIAAIPLFTIAGYILSQGSAGSRLLEVFKSFFGWFRGGTVIAAVIVATFFTTFT
ncbi:MAG: TRAP transporter large permease subunit, partial [Treponemataceae bacterium]